MNHLNDIDVIVLGLGAFLVAHLCYLGALLRLRGRSGPRLAGAAVVVGASVDCASAEKVDSNSESRPARTVRRANVLNMEIPRNAME